MTATTSFEHLAPFSPLLGTWRIAAHSSPHWEGTVEGEATFEWFDDGAFLLHRSNTPPPFPVGFYVIGGREDGGDHPGEAHGGDVLAHYFDSRNVWRVFHTSFTDGVWSIWRDEPGFDQRYRGRLATDGRRIDGVWEMRNDDDWFVDFHLDYIRAG
jgi:hypothetical protein